MLLFENRFIYSAENISESFPAFQQICHTFKLKDPSVATGMQRQNVKKKGRQARVPLPGGGGCRLHTTTESLSLKAEGDFFWQLFKRITSYRGI